MIYTRYWLKLGTAAVAAGAAATALVAWTRPPAMTTVGVLVRTVPAMHGVSRSIVHWTRIQSPPANAITPAMSWGNLVAQHQLAAGTILTTTDFVTPQINALHAGEVQWLVPVSAASSGLPALGQRVDVWADHHSTFRVVAYGVRVIGLYARNGSNVSNAGPGLVALAVPHRAMKSLLDVPSPYLVVDPNHSSFQLASTASSAKPSLSAASALSRHPASTTKTAHTVTAKSSLPSHKTG